MQKNSVICAGLSCIDIIKSEANEEYSIGGTAANVASILSQLGLKVSLLIPQYNDLYCDLLFLWFLLNKYPKVQSELHTNVIRQLLADAQDVAAQSCLYLGAQGIFSSAEGTSFLKNRFNRDIRLLPKFVLGPCHESLCKNCRSYLL